MVDFSQSFFGKSLNELLYSDIENFFVEEREESTRIEFKAFEPTYGDFNKGLEGVIRGLCAFLNSEGGILIWGAPVGAQVQGKKEKVFKGNLSPLSDEKEKDWLVNKVSDSITPLPVGINVSILKNGDHILYVFEVQASHYSPHQFKNIYFARLDGQSRPAPHYLIEALFRKISYPNIEGFVKINQISDSRDGYLLYVDFNIFIFNFSPLQNERNTVVRLLSSMGTFVKGVNTGFSQELVLGGDVAFDNIPDTLHFGQPILEYVRLRLSKKELESRNQKIDLVLSFGGRFSPLKSSSYKLDFSKVDSYNFNDAFVDIDENVLSSTLQERLGSNRENLLKKFIGR